MDALPIKLVREGAFFVVMLATSICAAAKPVSAEGAAPINELFFKSTHNSYACRELCEDLIGQNTCPVAHHHPGECSDLWEPCYNQIDDFGVWAIDLDFGIDGSGRYIVGHDGSACPEGSWTNCSWGPGLEDYFVRIKRTRAAHYRPVFIFLEKKPWGRNPPPSVWIPDLEAWLEVVYNSDGDDHIFGPADLVAWDLGAHGGSWPTVPDLAGMVVPVFMCQPFCRDHDECYFSEMIFYKDGDGYIKYKDEAGNDHHTGLRRPRSCDTCGQSKLEVLLSRAMDPEFNFAAMDMYQYDWTFLEQPSISRWAPPNPIVIDCAARLLSPWPVSNAADPEGTASCWKWNWCGNWCSEIPRDFSVAQHGTFGFPYDTVIEGVDRAKPGWTVLIRAGTYPETLMISKKLVIEAEGGTVVVGSSRYASHVDGTVRQRLDARIAGGGR